ncbi:hypothetical protein [Aeromonas veronii]|uniref:hypothetical protein n=1 Tax=Aeromonas veronii TaxID=654 RepID=UPI002444A52D|nr:hypothetical protein [Aeromonas veronii]
MSLDTLFSLCRKIDLLCLECRVVMDAAGSLDEQAGSLLHGSLGWAMKEAAPRLWQDAYGPLEQGAVRPPLAPSTTSREPMATRRVTHLWPHPF